jgi:Protein of unknown function (DUF3102)
MSTAAAQIKVRDRGLDLLAEEIREHHKAVERHARAMLDEAVAAGEKLLDAKARLPHGELGPFIAYCGLSRSNATNYMQLARAARDESASAGILEADSIRGALRTLAGEPKKKPKLPVPMDFFSAGYRNWPPSYANDELWVKREYAMNRIKHRLTAWFLAEDVDEFPIERLRYLRDTFDRALHLRERHGGDEDEGARS